IRNVLADRLLHRLNRMLRDPRLEFSTRYRLQRTLRNLAAAWKSNDRDGRGLSLAARANSILSGDDAPELSPSYPYVPPGSPIGDAHDYRAEDHCSTRGGHPR
ncbi:MAG: hypothetical protein AAF517_02980, partial [Planctomycetota bacterium]